MARSPSRFGGGTAGKKAIKKHPSGARLRRIGGGGALWLGSVHPVRQAHPARAEAQGGGRQYQQRCVRHGMTGDTVDEGASLDLCRRRVNAADAAPLEQIGATHATTPRRRVVRASAKTPGRDQAERCDRHGGRPKWTRAGVRHPRFPAWQKMKQDRPLSQA
ncbi:hypothetical protein [Xanthomonas translucens]